jgi:uncharacterized protein YqjF (DUF2071 family)
VSRPFLTAAWRHLVMLNYQVPAALLQPLVPAGTELDRWEGATLASVVGFRFLGTRVLGMPIPGHRDFDEVNLRFYVRRRSDDGTWRRAVVFVRELVPRRAIAWVARWCYNEPYLAVPMRHQVDMAGAAEGRPGRAAYSWRLRGQWYRLEATTRGRPAVPPPGSAAAFIAEHYWGYTVQRDGGALEYQVEHPPWRVWQTAQATLVGELDALYGPSLAKHLKAEPVSALVADGSDVTVQVGHRLPPVARPVPPGESSDHPGD